ncbi:hypothetical protein KFK09_014748 [Dendrobium nobile]|uniref:Uncharacterized protein n=1 Tax=Dendrobium nobile TaxID=94219 RepID=A0A8T3B493_DENNO|nr:hypothetical protein KFK09_014748 [Dendrobium nobile]
MIITLNAMGSEIPIKWGCRSKLSPTLLPAFAPSNSRFYILLKGMFLNFDFV